MNRLNRFLGVIAFGWSFAVIYYCVVNTPGFNITKQVISDLGAVKKVATFYNLSIVISALLLMVFVNFLANSYKWKVLTRILFSLSALGLLLVGLFPVKYPLIVDLQRYYHWSGAALFFLGLPAGVISANLGKKNLKSYFQICWGILSMILPVYVFFFTEYRGFAELMSIIMNSIWLLGLSFIVISDKKVK